MPTFLPQLSGSKNILFTTARSRCRTPNSAYPPLRRCFWVAQGFSALSQPDFQSLAGVGNLFSANNHLDISHFICELYKIISLKTSVLCIYWVLSPVCLYIGRTRYNNLGGVVSPTDHTFPPPAGWSCAALNDSSLTGLQCPYHLFRIDSHILSASGVWGQLYRFYQLPLLHSYLNPDESRWEFL